MTMGLYAKMTLPWIGLMVWMMSLWSCTELEGMEPLPPAAPKEVRILALGDSYTIGQSVPQSGRWPVQLADSLKSEGKFIPEVQIIARTGWRTDNLQNAITSAQPDSSFDLVTLLIGVNNQYQGRSSVEYAGEFQALLETSKALAGGQISKVLVVSIPDYGYTPFGEAQQPSISQDIDEFNAINKQLSEAAGVAYVDITPISRESLERPELVASDGLHPSAQQYAEWVQLILPVATSILAQ